MFFPLHDENKLKAIKFQYMTIAIYDERIGTVTDDPQRFVQMATAFGGRRVVDWLSGEPLPRIC